MEWHWPQYTMCTIYCVNMFFACFVNPLLKDENARKVIAGFIAYPLVYGSFAFILHMGGFW
jgi:hypothetical protein